MHGFCGGDSGLGFGVQGLGTKPARRFCGGVQGCGFLAPPNSTKTWHRPTRAKPGTAQLDQNLAPPPFSLEWFRVLGLCSYDPPPAQLGPAHLGFRGLGLRALGLYSPRRRRCWGIKIIK